MTATEPPAEESPTQALAQNRRFVTIGTVAALLLMLLVFQDLIARRIHFYLEQPRYSHCLLVPLIAAIWIYDRFDKIAAVPRAPSMRGLAVAALGVVLHLYGLLQHFNYVQHAALLVTLCGVIAALWGGAVLRHSWFAIAYLIFTIPLPRPWDDAITLPLQGMATSVAETVFDALGFVVVRQGNVLQMPGLKLLVEDACSGVHSLYALVALGVAWTGFVERPRWLQLTLILATVPISVTANSIRVVVTGVLAFKVDPKYAQGLSHSTTGMIVFVIGLVLFLVVDWCLRPDPPLPVEEGASTDATSGPTGSPDVGA